MPKPKRIQRRRTKGWWMPPNTVYVGRPSFWGNPFRVGGEHDLTRAEVVSTYRMWLATNPVGQAVAEAARMKLRGKDLACWCLLDQPCHADVLLEIANV